LPVRTLVIGRPQDARKLLGVTRRYDSIHVRIPALRAAENLRLASEEGAQVEAEGAAVKAAGMHYVHLPFNIQTPDPALVDDFIAAVTRPDNQPAYVHCAAGGRAAVPSRPAIGSASGKAEGSA
jgi:rhodanese-related sulfurtransferase